MAERVYLLLGSNQGAREAYLKAAHEALVRSLAGSGVEASGIYETAAWGLEDQPPFLNQAISLETEARPEAVLESIRVVEAAAARRRDVRWGQRTLDVDILFYGNLVLTHPQLQIPHPELQNRRFVLAPLAEIAPDFLHPVLKKTVADLLGACPDLLPVTRLEPVSESETESP